MSEYIEVNGERVDLRPGTFRPEFTVLFDTDDKHACAIDRRGLEKLGFEIKSDPVLPTGNGAILNGGFGHRPILVRTPYQRADTTYHWLDDLELISEASVRTYIESEHYRVVFGGIANGRVIPID